MEEEIKIGKKIFIRSIGKDEYWLQDLIYSKPERLGLIGNLVSVRKEKIQSKGGRLDLLLKDTTDNTMYEVEIMLGETDPSHIIRSIEYWDNEKRKYPQRQHFAVLIAESFDRRYFNVIQLLSLTVPMIAIQVDLLEVGTERILNFTKIIDVYVEPEDEEEEKPVTEITWNEKSFWTLETVKQHFSILMEIEKYIELKFTQSYICIVINSKNSYYYDKRGKPNSVIWFKIKDDEKAATLTELLENNNIDFVYTKNKDFSFTLDKQFLIKNKDLLKNIHGIKERELSKEEE